MCHLIEGMVQLVPNRMVLQPKGLLLEQRLEDITTHLQTGDQVLHLSRQELVHKDLNQIDSGHHCPTITIPLSLNQSLCNPKIHQVPDQPAPKDLKILTPQTDCIRQTAVQELTAHSQVVFTEVKQTAEALELIGSEESRLLWVLPTLIAEAIQEVVHQWVVEAHQVSGLQADLIR